MNTFLQGCCFIPPEEDNTSTPSYVSFTPRSIPPTRLSAHFDSDVSSERSKETLYLKIFPSEGRNESDEDINTTTRSSSSRKSFDKLSGSSKSTLKTIDMRNRKRVSSASLRASKHCPSEHMSYCAWKQNIHTPVDCYTSTYASKSPKHITTSMSRLLDSITMCFWKCSPGCQQIPTVHY